MLTIKYETLFAVVLLVLGVVGATMTLVHLNHPNHGNEIAAIVKYLLALAVIDNAAISVTGVLLLRRAHHLRIAVCLLWVELLYFLLAVGLISLMKSKGLIAFELSRTLYVAHGGIVLRQMLMLPLLGSLLLLTRTRQ